MTSKENMIIAVLECRLEIVRLAANKYATTEEGKQYFLGKADGYQQAIDLIKEKEESIKIEL